MIPITTHELFVLLNYISVFVMFGCCAVISTHSESRMQKLALMVCFSLTMCCVGFLFRSEAEDAQSFILGQKLVYAFVTHGMFLMLLFIVEYCKLTIASWVKWLFHSLNFLISLAVLTLDHHPFFYKSYWAVPMDGYCLLEKEYGFLHTVAVGLFALYMASAVIITVVYSIRNMRKKSKYVWRILVAVMLPCVSYIIPKLTGSNNDFQPLAFMAFSLLVLYMIYRNNLYDTDNIAARFSIASVEDALVVFDAKDHFEGSNKLADELFPVLKTINLDAPIRAEQPLFAAFLDGELTEYKHGDQVYSVTLYPIREGNIALGKVLKLDNITLQRQYTDLLQEHQRQLESQVELLAKFSYKDDLTGLGNRRSYEEAVSRLKEQKDLSSVVVGTADLNGLKTVNDTIYHAAGDELIIGAARIMEKVFSPYGKVYRIGGDEFSVILTVPPSDLDACVRELEQEAQSWQSQYGSHLSISCGFVSGLENQDASIDQLLILADKAMYRFKTEYYRTAGIDRRKQ